MKNLRADISLLIALCVSLWLFFYSDFGTSPFPQGKLAQIPTSFKWQPPAPDFSPPASSLLESVYLTINPEDFFSYEKGIYVPGKEWDAQAFKKQAAWWDRPANYHQRGKSWEREGSISYGNKKANAHPVKIRVNGNATRAYAQKSLRIYPGNKKEKLFPNWTNQEGNRVIQYAAILRNGGNDWTKCLFRDVLIQEIIKDLNVFVQPGKPVSLYINGEYWGIHNLRPRIDEKHLAAVYATKKKGVAIIEGKTLQKNKTDEGAIDFKALLDKVKSADPTPGNFEHIGEQLDVPGFIDYLIVQTFFSNADWPRNNVELFRISRSYALRKWRFMLTDLDYGFGYSGLKAAVTKDMFTHIATTKNTLIEELLGGLMRFDAFPTLLAERWELLKNKTLSTENLLEQIDAFEMKYAPHMPAHIARWRKIESMEMWRKNVEELRVFARERHIQYEQHLRQFTEK